jgi:hypothetical protein
MISANENGTQCHAGILFKDTGGDNERLAFGLMRREASPGGDDYKSYGFQILRYTGASPPVLSATPLTLFTETPWKWIRVNNDGTTLTFYASLDGKNWRTVGTETLAAFIDGAASYGVFARGTALSTDVRALFSYFSTTAPS